MVEPETPVADTAPATETAPVAETDSPAGTTPVVEASTQPGGPSLGGMTPTGGFQTGSLGGIESALGGSLSQIAETQGIQELAGLEESLVSDPESLDVSSVADGPGAATIGTDGLHFAEGAGGGIASDQTNPMSGLDYGEGTGENIGLGGFESPTESGAPTIGGGTGGGTAMDAGIIAGPDPTGGLPTGGFDEEGKEPEAKEVDAEPEKVDSGPKDDGPEIGTATPTGGAAGGEAGGEVGKADEPMDVLGSAEDAEKKKNILEGMGMEPEEIAKEVGDGDPGLTDFGSVEVTSHESVTPGGKPLASLGGEGEGEEEPQANVFGGLTSILGEEEEPTPALEGDVSASWERDVGSDTASITSPVDSQGLGGLTGSIGVSADLQGKLSGLADYSDAASEGPGGMPLGPDEGVQLAGADATGAMADAVSSSMDTAYSDSGVDPGGIPLGPNEGMEALEDLDLDDIGG